MTHPESHFLRHSKIYPHPFPSPETGEGKYRKTIDAIGLCPIASIVFRINSPSQAPKAYGRGI
jgi:hypothetical protein